jgi:hypothetical protein
MSIVDRTSGDIVRLFHIQVVTGVACHGMRMCLLNTQIFHFKKVLKVLETHTINEVNWLRMS